MAAKVVVLGSVNGKLNQAFQKLATLHSKNNFSFALITGNLFGEDDEFVSRLLTGDIKVPLTTYFTVGTAGLPQQVIERIEKDHDVCENLHFLGKRSINTTSDGIRIATLGGALDNNVDGLSKEQHLPFHTVGDATSLRGANRADILLTSIWPKGIWTKSGVVLAPENQAVFASSDEVAQLCAAIKPRYHFSFSPEDFFYEREPFLHPATEDSPDNKLVTRFISLAPFENCAKAKAMYAFNLQAGETMSIRPPGTTGSPFLPSMATKRRARDTDVYSGRFADSEDHPDGSKYRRGRRGQRIQEPPPGPDRCFFCLSNANLETHMICSIGEFAYLAAAKGPLPSSNFYSSSGLNFPCHQIIIPLAHEPTIDAIPEESQETFTEMIRFRDSLQAMVATQSQYSLGAITWEISRAKNIHLHWQFLPVPIDFLRKGLVEAAFKVEAENLGYPSLVETEELGSGIGAKGDFFRIWVWSDDSDIGIKGKELVMRLDEGFRFDLQFPRNVLAKLLQLEHRIRWRDVAQSKDEETADVERFKVAFKQQWDFTLRES